MDHLLVGLEVSEVSELEDALHRALEYDEFALLFQPFVNIGTGVIQGYEALIRWGRPGRPIVQPGAFLPVAQTSDLICEIDAWVLRTAISYLARWQDKGIRDRILSINLGGRHVAQSRVVADVKIALAASRVNAERLLVEVAEPVLSHDPETRANLEALRDLGVGICLDDFGTGIDSAAQLAGLPIDIVKIDPSYLDLTNDLTRGRLRDLIQVPQELGLPVVIEGVESQAQLDFVADLGCEWAQGFHLAIPTSPMEVETMELNWMAD